MDTIYSYPPEYMHLLCLGVVQLFTKAWFEPKYSDEEFYLGSKLTDFNTKLLSIASPTEITRLLCYK